MKNLQDVAQNKWLRLGCSIGLALALSSVLLLIPITAVGVVRVPVPDLTRSWGASLLKPDWSSGRSIDVSLPLGIDIVRATGGLTITKSASAPAVNQGGLLTYTLVVHNDTSFDLTDVVVVDTVPANTTCQDIQSPSGWFNNGVANCQNDGEAKWLLPKLGGGSLADGSTAVLTYTIQVDQPLPDLSTIENVTYSVVASDTAGVGSFSDAGSIYTTTVYAPEWQISKSVVPTPNVKPGDLLTYTISVLNDGHLDASGLYTVTDVIPQYTSYIASTQPVTETGSMLTWVFSETLDIGASRVVTYVVQVQVNDHPLSDGLSIVNDTYSVAGANVYASATGSPVAVTVQAPDLQITKSDGADPIWAGGTLTYTLIYSNSGGADATGVVVSDTIDGITAFVDSTPDPSSNAGDSYYWDIGTLSAGITDSIVITVSVPSPLPNDTLLTNMAAISSPMGYTDQAIENTTVAGSPVLHLLKEASTEIVEPGEFITYTISYSNSGNAPAFGVRITDTIDGNTSFVNSDPLPDGGSYYWDISEPLTSSTRQITLTVRVTDSLPNETTLTNQAIIRDSGDISDTHQATVIVQSAPILHVAKEASANVIEPGDTLTYTIWYSNTGNAPATGIVISDDLPAELHFLSAEPSPFIGGDQQQVWDVGSVNVGGPYSITLVVTSNNVITDMTDLTNQVTLSSVETAPVVSDETVTVHSVELSVDKTSSAVLVKADEFITYTITVTNSGHAVADQVHITDTLPISIVQASVVSSTSPGVVFDSATPPQYVWTAPTLDALAPLIITVSGRLITSPWTASGEVFTNTVQVGSENTEVDLSNNSDLAPVTGRPGDPYTITLTAAITETVVGDTVPVTATITDPWGNPAYDEETVFFDSSLGLTLPSFTNPQLGVATTTLSSLQSGEAIITGTVGGIDATTSVTFLAGAAHHFVFTPSITSPQTAGVPFSATILAMDAYNNVVPGYTTAADLDDATSTMLPISSGTGWVGGVWSGTVTITGAIRNNIITATSGVISGTSNLFDVQPGAPDSATLTVTTPMPPCGATSVHTATVRDSYGNALWAGTPATFYLVDVGGTGATLVPTSPYVGYTNDSGVVTATIQSTSITGAIRLEVDIDGDFTAEDLKIISISGVGIATNMQIDASPPSIVVGTTSLVTVVLRDCGGQLVPGAGIDLAASGLGSLSPASGSTNANGVFTSTFTAGLTPGTVDVTATSGLLIGSTPITVTGGPIFDIKKTANPEPSTTIPVTETITYLIVVTNTGDPATGFVLSDPIPANSGYVPGSANASDWATLTEGNPLQVSTNSFTGSGQVLTVTFAVTPTGGGDISNQASITSEQTMLQASTVVSHLVATGSGTGNVFLPIIVKNWDGTIPPTPTDANLIVDSISFLGAPPANEGDEYHVQVVVKNIGTDPVTADFWVDLYLNPNPATPAVNQPWQLLSQSGDCPDGSDCYGRAWLVEASQTPLAPGQVITLTTQMPLDQRYDRWPTDGAPYANTHSPIKALADSWGSSYGAVYENEEGDNLSGSISGANLIDNGTDLNLPSIPPTIRSLPAGGRRPVLPKPHD
jgi:uncharacterized repeat protein (TIGR01451 family)